MAGADPNPISTHLSEPAPHPGHATKTELAEALAALRAELLAVIAAVPGAKAADKPTK